MLVPLVAAWMKKRNDIPRLGIKRTQIAAFMAVTICTGKAKIGFYRITAMLFCVDMVNFMGVISMVFVQATVFTA